MSRTRKQKPDHYTRCFSIRLISPLQTDCATALATSSQRSSFWCLLKFFSWPSLWFLCLCLQSRSFCLPPYCLFVCGSLILHFFLLRGSWNCYSMHLFLCFAFKPQSLTWGKITNIFSFSHLIFLNLGRSQQGMSVFNLCLVCPLSMPKHLLAF